MPAWYCIRERVMKKGGNRLSTKRKKVRKKKCFIRSERCEMPKEKQNRGHERSIKGNVKVEKLCKCQTCKRGIS